MYGVIQKHFKGGKNHHVEAARQKLNTHRFGPDIERDISRLWELISDLEIAEKMETPESQKFGILRTIMRHEDRAHVCAVYGMTSYHKECFNSTIKKIKEEWDAIPSDKYEAPMAASKAPLSVDRTCFLYQTNECIRPKCPFTHKIMSEQERKEQNYLTKLPGKKTFTSKHIMSRNLKGKLIQGITTLRLQMECITIYH